MDGSGTGIEEDRNVPETGMARRRAPVGVQMRTVSPYDQREVGFFTAVPGVYPLRRRVGAPWEGGT